MSATSGGGGSVSEGSEAGGSSQSTMSVGESPSTSFQPNLVENVTKITLSEETGTGGFASVAADVTGSKINLSMEERQQKDGIVNVAFDYEEDANRHVSGGAGGVAVGGGGVSAGVGAGGDFRSINGSEKKDKVPEAVNLELVNMVPYSNGNGTSYGVPVNGIPMKKDSEQVDMSTPYDEYFVPVNEHKKYMRGEKLYVTKDKRRPTSWRRCLSWIVACTVISVVLILAILAGTGVILSQEPDLVKDASVGRNFAGSNLKQSVTNKSPTPTAEMYMYVPRSIESEFVIDNLDFDPAFKDLNSTAYKEFATTMEDQLRMLLFDKETLEFGASDVGLKVVNVSRDPFKVNYRIGWNYKQGVNNPPEPIKMEDVKKRLVESLTRNQGYIDKYHIDREAIKVNHVINTCQMENGGCSHICYYNYVSQQFVCTCPTHLVLDSSGKNCVAWTGSSEDDALPVPSHTAYPGMPYESTANPVHEHEITANHDHGLHHHQHDHSSHGFKGSGDEGREPTPEPGSEHTDGSSGTYSDQGIHSSQGTYDHGSAPEPTPEPDAKNKYDHSGHDHSGHDHSHHGGYSVYESEETEAEPEPTAEEYPTDRDHGTHVTYETKQHEPSAEPTAEHDGQQNSEARGHDHDSHSLYGVKDYSSDRTSEPGSSSSDETNFNSKHHSVHGSTQSESEPAPEPTAEGDSAGKTHDHVGYSVHGFKDHEPSAEPTPEPTGEGDSTAKGHYHAGHAGYESQDHEPSAEPTPEPTAEGDSVSKGHDHMGHSFYESKDHEPSAEPTPEPTAEGDYAGKDHNQAGQGIHGLKDHEPSAEPTPEPTADDDSTAKGHGHAGHSTYESKDHEPSAEPTPEPTADDDSTQKGHGHTGLSIHESKDHEPSAEPTPEPTAEGDLAGKDHNQAGQGIHGLKDHEPSAEPTPEPTADDDSTAKGHGHAGHSTYESKDHEPSAEPTPEPTVDDDSIPRGHGHVGHSDSGSNEQEPSAEPTPESEGDSSGNGHGVVNHSVFPTKDHEPSAESTPEPTAEGDHTGKDRIQEGQAMHGLKDREPSAEPTPEGDSSVTGQDQLGYSKPEVPKDNASSEQGNSTPKDHEQVGHSDSEPKDHEPSAEPTPGSDSTVRGHISNSGYEPEVDKPKTPESESTVSGHISGSGSEPKDHEPSAEPTPSSDSTESGLDGNSGYEAKGHKPLGEGDSDNSSGSDVTGHVNLSGHEPKNHDPSAEPTSEATAEGDSTKKGQKAGTEEKDHEPSAEPTPEPTSNDDSDRKAHDLVGHMSKEHEPSAGHDSTGYSVYEPKDHEPSSESDSNEKNHDSALHTVFRTKDQELSTESATKSGGSDQTTTPTDQNISSVPTSGDFREEIKVLSAPARAPGSQSNGINSDSSAKGEHNLEHPGTTLSPFENMNSDQDKKQMTESQTERTVGVSAIQNESEKEHKPAHHAPHLEDILIRRPTSENQNPTNPRQNPLDNVELTEDGKPVIEEVIIDGSKGESTSGLPSRTAGQPENESKPDSSSMTTGTGFGSPKGSTSDANDSTTKVPVAASTGETASTDHPKIIEYTAQGSSSPINTETGKSGSESTSNPTKEGTAIGIDQNGSRDPAVIRIHETQQGNMPVTTMNPHVQTEYHTIPVFVGSPGSREENTETKPTQGSSTSVSNEGISSPDLSKTNSETLSPRPGIMETDHISGHPIDVKLFGGSNQMNARETSTESQPSETTLLTILTPEGVKKITNHMAKSPEDMNSTDNRTVNSRQTPTDENETTKSPEDISNTIKDELSENEEFNTLLGKDYRTTPSEGKDAITKYPNKSLKPEKKIKDYAKGDKSVESTARPAVTPEDFILQKHVNGNENIYDLDYSLQNEHTTKHHGEVTIVDPHSIDSVPGVSFKPHGINNHDISVLQTVAPDFRMETTFPTGGQDPETLKSDSKTKFADKDGQTDKDYPKFEKDFKYEKQKVSKKKELKKKTGGKDGKNVELGDGRRYFTDITKDDFDTSQEDMKDLLETTMNPSFDKITEQPENTPGSEIIHEFKVRTDGIEATITPVNSFETDVRGIGITELPAFKSSNKEFAPQQNQGTGHHNQQIGLPNPQTEQQNQGTGHYNQQIGLQNPQTEQQNQGTGHYNQQIGLQNPQTEHQNQGTGHYNQQTGHQNQRTFVDQSTHLMIDEPTVKSRPETLPGTVYDGQINERTVSRGPGGAIQMNTTYETPGTVFDGIPHVTNSGTGEGENTTFVVYKTTNSKTAHPTIIINGQSGSLQDGHAMRFANSTFFNPGNATIVSMFNGTVTHPAGHSFTFTNYTATFPNGSSVNPTIVVRGQSGTLQDGHQSRFGNVTYVTSSGHPINFRTSNVYRIENGTHPGTVFNGQRQYVFTNSTGTFVYTNGTGQPGSGFTIRGESGDFGNSTVYVIGNHTRTTFPGGFVGPQSVIFRNSTVFAVEDGASGELRQFTVHPYNLTSNETIHYTSQMSPSFVSSGTAYKVNDYFGYISKCAAGQFQCLNGTSRRGSACISLSSKCDSIPDCSDGSDELGCIENGCPGNFQCADGTCLKRNLVCNGILDCSDASDEKNCESWKCEFDEFQCPSGRCIPVVWQCDGKPDCENHTDEYNCQTSCGNDEYLCPEGWCVPSTYKCNGVKECSNGEDEQLCDCSHEEFKCNAGGCVSMNLVCNGLDDCPDRSDEWDCVKLEPESNLLKIRSPSGNYEPVCADGWSSRFSDDVCASLGYFSSVPIENENGSSIMTDSSFYVLKNDTTADFRKKVIVNLMKSERNCSSGKLVEISCQEFSCGSRSMTDSSSVEARLVGGMSAASGQWPSVSLLYNMRNFHSCTANVLTPRWVLASYNCLKMGNKNLNEQDWKFFGGSTVFEAEKENAETRKILTIIPHPQVKFNQFLFTNDLALVELDESLQFTSNIGAVCLPEQEIQPRQICVTAGWGMNGPEDKAIRQQLQYLPVPTMNLTECNSTEHYAGFITDDKICAGYNSAQKSLCYNEEGAPLMCVNDRGEWELQGVLSYHSNCGRGSHPSIFSSITPVADWIKKTIGNSFDRKTLAVTKR